MMYLLKTISNLILVFNFTQLDDLGEVGGDGVNVVLESLVVGLQKRVLGRRNSVFGHLYIRLDHQN
jgi:hypothetical protein